MQYAPTVNDRSGELRAAGIIGASQTNANTQQQMGQSIGSALSAIGGMYAENKALDAKAKGYDHVGKILGDSMFKGNPAVGSYLSELRKVKNPMERISGYESLFGLAGPMSNAMMAQGRFDQAQVASTAAPGMKLYNDNQKTISEEGPGYSGATRRLY